MMNFHFLHVLLNQLEKLCFLVKMCVIVEIKLLKAAVKFAQNVK